VLYGPYSSPMFSQRYRQACEDLARLRTVPPPAVDSLRPGEAAEFVSLLWSEGLGCGGDLDQSIIARSNELKRSLYDGRVFVTAPMYATSICWEQCVYCNYRAGNKGVGVERKRLTDDELEQEASYLVDEKGMRVLELVYASDPKMRVDAMCRHVELLRTLLERRGGGLVGISAEALDEADYRQLVDAGLCWSVLWQETYDSSSYAKFHPGKTKKTNFAYRLDAYERMLSAGVKHVGIGVLSGLADWRWDWSMLLLHEQYLQEQCGRGATILGTPRLKLAPGALLKGPPNTMTRDELVVTVALHNLFAPTATPFVSTREDWDVCLELARGGGCLFTLNCSTTPGGYSLPRDGCQFSSNSYDAPVYSTELRRNGLEPVFDWKAGYNIEPSTVPPEL